MKYAKTFSDLLASPNFDSPEFRASAVQYKELKKIITRVIDELSSLGLTSEVLQELLADTKAEPGINGKEPSGSRRGRTLPDSPDGERISQHCSTSKLRESIKSVVRYELTGTAEHPLPRIRVIFSSSDSSDEDSELIPNPSVSFLKRVRSASHSSRATSPSGLPSDLPSTAVSTSEQDDDIYDEFGLHHSGLKVNSLMNQIYGNNIIPVDQVQSPTLLTHDEKPTQRQPDTDVKCVGSRPDDACENLKVIDLQEPAPIDVPQIKRLQNTSMDRTVSESSESGTRADDEADSIPIVSSKRKKRRRHEVCIPLTNDTKFFELLAGALTNLTKLQVAQKSRFAESVEGLSREVARVSSPYKNKSDLYSWREVFSLWVEAQIFEGELESDRGEHSIKEAQTRLQWFADQVGRRNLVHSMKHAESRKALEDFVALNENLMDLKQFHTANEEAVRKIIKKHDKQTALSSLDNFQYLLNAGSSTGGDIIRYNQKTTVLDVLPSLPHILLATFTGTLLPILPQVDDYSCMICGDVAYRPIRLRCGHFFCLRDLVKMQKRSQNACPACRAPVVMEATGGNLDSALAEFMKLWFPREIKAKQKEDSREVTLEEIEELELDPRCIIS